MMTLIAPSKAQDMLAKNIRARRLARGLTQAGLSERSGVALTTLRKFERTGAISVKSLCKLMMIVGGLEQLVAASAPVQSEFNSIDEVLASKKAQPRRRGYRS
ncbi:MAG: helix-turn-helix domain-containing protein [Robiginitomaculum sp.]|nr:helix-turn-helix domain-containing protein [Robiginitomaculum sp.]